jgi:hypothetical protein
MLQLQSQPDQGLPVDAISQLLDGTAEEVAANLRSRGITGRRISLTHYNPVVRFLKQNVDIGGRLEIDTSGTTLWIFRGGKITDLDLPAAVQQFLRGFAAGLYPALET